MARTPHTTLSPTPPPPQKQQTPRQVARESVEGVLAQWRALLDAVGDSQRGELQRAMGLKMEQLRAELKELDELHA